MRECPECQSTNLDDNIGVIGQFQCKDCSKSFGGPVFYTDALEWCGCMDDDVVTDIEETLLAIADENGDAVHPNLPDFERKYLLLIKIILDNAGLLDHGSSIRFPWITEEGKKWTKIIRELR